jgi:hypothetical protein
MMAEIGDTYFRTDRWQLCTVRHSDCRPCLNTE